MKIKNVKIEKNNNFANDSIIAIVKNNKLTNVGYFIKTTVDKLGNWIYFSKSKLKKSKGRGILVDKLEYARLANKDEINEFLN